MKAFYEEFCIDFTWTTIKNAYLIAWCVIRYLLIDYIQIIQFQGNEHVHLE